MSHALATGRCPTLATTLRRALTLATTLLGGRRPRRSMPAITGPAFSCLVCTPLGNGTAHHLPGDEPWSRPPKATPELGGLARPQARTHKEAEEEGGMAAAHGDVSSVLTERLGARVPRSSRAQLHTSLGEVLRDGFRLVQSSLLTLLI